MCPGPFSALLLGWGKKPRSPSAWPPEVWFGEQYRITEDIFFSLASLSFLECRKHAVRWGGWGRWPWTRGPFSSLHTHQHPGPVLPPFTFLCKPRRMKRAEKTLVELGPGWILLSKVVAPWSANILPLSVQHVDTRKRGEVLTFDDIMTDMP